MSYLVRVPFVSSKDSHIHFSLPSDSAVNKLISDFLGLSNFGPPSRSTHLSYRVRFPVSTPLFLANFWSRPETLLLTL